MNGFETELMRRSPLAGCVLELGDHVFDDRFLCEVYDANRGRCYQDTLTFGDFLALMRDALVHHGGSAHALFVELEADKAHPVNESNFYRKLARMPVAVSRALLREGTARLAALMPGPVNLLPACFDAFDVVICDGKKIKDAAHRLAPTRGFTGALIGARALVGIDARTGLALAMSDSLDGMGNDSPLVPGLMPQLTGLAGERPLVTIWDRGFGEPKTMRAMTTRPGDAFITRVKANHSFTATSRVQTTDAKGRTIIDEAGFSGGASARARHPALATRRITLRRPGAEDVILVTNLTDAAAYPAADVLELYARRWGIEQVFQQVTETFSLQHLIGCAPKAVLLQFAYCLLLYNMMQVVRAFVAEDGGVPVAVVSMHYLFDHTRRQLQAWAYHTDGNWPRSDRTPAEMRRRLRELLAGVWDPKLFIKAADKRPRVKSKPKARLKGGHNSVQRVLDGTAKCIAL
jgi:hypothetical protein